MKKTSQEVPVSYVFARYSQQLSSAADVTITVNGRVVAKPCTIQTKEANVNLGDLYTRNLQQPRFCIRLAQYYFVINRLSG